MITEKVGHQPSSLTIAQLIAGVDWMTITVAEDTARKEMYRRFAKVRESHAISRMPAKNFSWRGYKGLQVSGLRWGTRADSDILIASGDLANTYWRLFAPLAHNVTRVDLAVTCSVKPPLPNLLRTYYENLGGEKYNWTRIENSNTHGQTLYTGSRSSDQYGRIYDKGRQSDLTPVPGEIWRYEVEYHREFAKQVMDYLVLESCFRKGPRGAIRSTVHAWFNRRNLPPLFDTQGAPPIEVRCEIRDHDLERVLTWLRVQVRPTLARVMLNHRPEVLDALGLGQNIQVNQGGCGEIKRM